MTGNGWLRHSNCPARELGGSIAPAVLRVALGSTMIAHGVRHGRTLAGTTRWFESIGFRRPKLQAQLSAAVEIGAGLAVLAGAATPLSSSAIVGTMAVAARTVHVPNGFFIVDEGWEYVAFVSSAAVTLSAMGPGWYSVDRKLGVECAGTPARRALLTLGLGLAGAAAQLTTFWRRPGAQERSTDHLSRTEPWRLRAASDSRSAPSPDASVHVPPTP